MSKGIREAPTKALMGELAVKSGDRPEQAFGKCGRLPGDIPELAKHPQCFDAKLVEAGWLSSLTAAPSRSAVRTSGWVHWRQLLKASKITLASSCSPTRSPTAFPTATFDRRMRAGCTMEATRYAIKAEPLQLVSC